MTFFYGNRLPSKYWLVSFIQLRALSHILKKKKNKQIHYLLKVWRVLDEINLNSFWIRECLSGEVYANIYGPKLFS